MTRLEAATSRLEDIATSTELPKDVSALTQPTASPSDALTVPVLPPGPGQAAEPLPESIEDFDKFLSSAVDKYAKLSDQLGGVVAKQVRDGGLFPAHPTPARSYGC